MVDLSTISQQFFQKNLKLIFVQDRNNIYLSSIVAFAFVFVQFSRCKISLHSAKFCADVSNFIRKFDQGASIEKFLRDAVPFGISLLQSWWAWEDSNLRPHAYQACALTTWATSPFDSRRTVVVSVFRRPLVEMRRIELLTPCLQGRCSPSWATPPYYRASEVFPLFPLFEGPQSFDCTL